MLIMPYNPQKHKGSLQTILFQNKMNVGLVDTLPAFGLVAEHQGDVMACGFARHIEGGYVMFDSYMTDPRAKGYHRNRALDLIAAKLIKLSKDNVTLLCITTESTIANRAQKHGFIETTHKVLIKPI